MWINPETGVIYSSHSEIRRGYPQVSFPEAITEQNIAEMGLLPVILSSKPEYDEITQDCNEWTAELIEGEWVQQWIVANSSDEDIAQKRSTMVVSPFQAKVALHQAGLLATIESMVSRPDVAAIIKLAWSHASEFRRLSPAILAIAAEAGWTDTQLDALFTAAKNVEA